MVERIIDSCSLGKRDFLEVWELQKQVQKGVIEGSQNDRVFFVEHFNIITHGKLFKEQHLVIGKKQLEQQGIQVVETDRGGDVTFHGEGQLVVYPILNMKHYYLDAHRYLRDLEEVAMKTLLHFGIKAERKTSSKKSESYTGVWVEEKKICAIGVKFSRWTTMHGLALNVNTDLKYFTYIVPCGLQEKGVTSMQKVLGKNVELREVEKVFKASFEDVFQVKLREL